jgi:hypothetical protein
MRTARYWLATALVCGLSSPSHAVEGSTAAGPIGGTDVRVALLPPPGVYGGIAVLGAKAFDFVDGRGEKIPGFGEADLSAKIIAPLLVYIPDFQVLGGSLAIVGTAPAGEKCGHIFSGTGRVCRFGAGDPYVEVSWARAFGTLRASKDPGAFPIFEGLAVAAGFGVVLPFGQYNAFEANNYAASVGNNIYDFAPSFAFTYTTAPILFEGTEVSAKLYWNNYLKNPVTQYATGALLDVDFAVTEHIGRFQVGVAGYYVTQIADDRQSGARIAPDGRRAEIMELGGVVAYDMPEYGASVKIKGLHTVITANTVGSYGVVVGLIKKLK